MHKFILANIILLMSWTMLLGQQTEQYTMYMFNKYQFNPAYAGFDRSLSVNAFYRSQWASVEGNPEQFGINAHMPIYLWNGAIGFAAETERLGVEQNTAFKVSYNYVAKTQLGILSTGLRLGLQSKKLDGSKIITPNGTYNGGTINHNDPFLPIDQTSSIIPTWTLGVYMANKFLEGGFSVSDLFGLNHSFEAFGYEQSKAVNLFVQSFFFVGDQVELKPGIFVKSNLKSVQTDLHLVGYYSEFFGGFNFRGYNGSSLESFGIIIGTRLSKNYSISYSFDSVLSDIRTISDGSHEVQINYNLNKLIGIGLPPNIIYNPRDL